MVDTLKPAPKKKRHAQPSAEPLAPLPNTTECVMPKKKKKVTPAPVESQPRSAPGLRAGFLEWLADFASQVEIVREHLEKGSDLSAALGDSATQVRNDMSSVDECLMNMRLKITPRVWPPFLCD